MLIKKEFFSHLKSSFFLIIAIIMILFTQLSNFDTLDKLENYQKFLNILPKLIKSILGINNFDISKISGIYGVLMLPIALLFLLYSSSLGCKITAKSPSNKSDFIYTTTYSRKKIYLKKLIANLVIILVVSTLNVLFSILILLLNNETSFLYVILINLNLFITSILFLLLGSFFKAFNDKTGLFIINTIILLFYLLNILSNTITKLNALKIINPFYFISNNKLINQNNFNYIYILSIITLVILTSILSYFTFKRKDL